MSLSQLSHLIMVGRVEVSEGPGPVALIFGARNVSGVDRTPGEPAGSFLVTPDSTTGGLNDQDCTPTATLYGATNPATKIVAEIVDDAGQKKLRIDTYNDGELGDASFTFAVQRVN